MTRDPTKHNRNVLIESPFKKEQYCDDKELLEEFHELKTVKPAKQSDKMITRDGRASKIHFNASIIAIYFS